MILLKKKGKKKHKQTRQSHLFVTGVNLAVMTVLSGKPEPDWLGVQILATLLERRL